MPLNIKILDGIIDNDSAFNFPFLFHNNIQNKRYKKHRQPFTEINNKCVIKPKVKICIGYIEYHKTKTTVSAICSAIITILLLYELANSFL